MTKKEFLRQYLDLSREIDAKLEEVSRYRALAMKVTQTLAPDKVQCTQGNKMESIIAKLVDLEKEVDAEIDRMTEIRESVEAAIANVPDSKYRTLLRHRYISGKTWEQIAVEMHYTYRHVIRQHGIAIKAVQIVGGDRNGIMETGNRI